MTNHFRNRQERIESDFSEKTGFIPAEVTFLYDGPDTEARVTIKGQNGQTYYGEDVALLSPKDAYNRETGEQLAFVRAAREALFDMELAIIASVETQEAVDARKAAEARAAQDAEDERVLKSILKSLDNVGKCEGDCVACRTGKYAPLTA